MRQKVVITIAVVLQMLLLVLVLAVANGQQLKQDWDASNFPNPTNAADVHRCGMRSQGLICDPDSVLDEKQRYRINYELQQLEGKTRQDHASDFCQKKGITAAVAVMRHIKGGSEYATKMLAKEVLAKWRLDSQCEKEIAVVVVTEDQKFWVGRSSRVPVYASEFTDIFNEQKPTFQRGQYDQAILNIIRATWERAQGKQARPSTDDGTSGGGSPFAPKPPKSGGGAKWIPPLWLLLVVFFIVIPLLLCGCCVYFCCCRKKAENGGGGGAVAGDEEDGQGGRGGGGGLLSGLGGGMLGSLGPTIGRLISGGGGGRRQGGGESGGGGGTPGYGPVPTHGGGGGQKPGLYPSTAVKDEGGGGSW